MTNGSQENAHIVEKLDQLYAEFVQMRLELSTAVRVHDTKIQQHTKDLEHAFDDIHKLEDKSWKVVASVIAAGVSLIGTVAITVLTLL